MTTKVDSRFATPKDTASILGVSARRVRELTRLIESIKRSRRSKGVSWVPPAMPRSEMASKRTQSKRQVAGSQASKKSKANRGRAKRGETSKKNR